MLFRLKTIITIAALVASASAGLAFVVDEDVEANRDAVRAAQTQLNDLGFDAGSPDGLFGRGTQGAIEAFFSRFGGSIEPGLTNEGLALIADVHNGRFGSVFDAGATVTPEGRLITNLFGVTDIQSHSPDCTGCNVTNMLLGAGDLNGDGADEAVMHQHATDGNFDVIDFATPLAIFSGTPGSIRPSRNPDFLPVDMPRRVHAREAVFADFNGDGVTDLFVAAHGLDAPPFPGEQNVLLLSGPDRLVDVSMTHLPILNDMAHGADASDIDGDGDIDIFVVTNEGETRTLPYLLRNDGNGSFSRVEANEIMDMEIVDFYATGRSFLAEYSTVRIADVNGDDAPDMLLLARGEEPSPAGARAPIKNSIILLNDGTGYFPTETVIELPTDRWGERTFTNDAEVIDLDGNGELDLILTQSTRPRNESWQGHYLQVLMQEDGTFFDRTHERLWSQGYNVALERLNFADKTRLADFDGDGDLDLVTSTLAPAYRDEIGDQAITIGLNDGTGRFLAVNPDYISEGRGDDRGYRARGQLIGDFDGDGIGEFLSYQLRGEYEDGPDRTFGAVLYIREAPSQR